MYVLDLQSWCRVKTKTTVLTFYDLLDKSVCLRNSVYMFWFRFYV